MQSILTFTSTYIHLILKVLFSLEVFIHYYWNDMQPDHEL